ncbi:hypothetical protein BO78DRAFT_435823 [Aspergillus sclerotiicarbonarius CBS 121057]|uniref:Uncharacterized protein n=1 Tax=Aspergillus sclerotiicarbonarius (strain CBS 121057 / IBT 28362) TaxID=1448318 RepID=A0A319DUT9_ASPSB|nr:hypothetical protein BO78DRAFT_435823 [Aspergillus sclerotiicarbonarius CBS 121057]
MSSLHGGAVDPIFHCPRSYLGPGRAFGANTYAGMGIVLDISNNTPLRVLSMQLVILENESSRSIGHKGHFHRVVRWGCPKYSNIGKYPEQPPSTHTTRLEAAITTSYIVYVRRVALQRVFIPIRQFIYNNHYKKLATGLYSGLARLMGGGGPGEQRIGRAKCSQIQSTAVGSKITHCTFHGP